MDLVKVKSLGSKSLFVDKESLNFFVVREYDLDAAEILNKLSTLGHNIRIPKIVKMKKGFKKITTVEEYIKGQTLAELIDSKHYISVEQFEQLVIELSSTLQKLHQNNIIHKDIKPDNIVLGKEGVYIIDFNISRTYKEEQTRDTKLYATEGYASPEQFGFSQTTVKSDVYSLGKTIEELLAITILEPSDYNFYIELIDKMIELDPDKRISLDEFINQFTDSFEEESEEQLNKQTNSKLPKYIQSIKSIKSFLNSGQEKGMNFKFAGLIINNQSIGLSIMQSIFYFVFSYSLIKEEYVSSNPSTIGIVASYYIATIVTNYFIEYATRKMWLVTENSGPGSKALIGFFKVIFDFIFFAIIIQLRYV